MSFEEYCARIEALLQLTGRKISQRRLLQPDTFIL